MRLPYESGPAQAAGGLVPRGVSAVGVFLFFALAAASARAQAPFAERPYEPVVVYGSSLSTLIGTPVGEVGGYAYDAETGRFRPIPLQVDEVGPGPDAFFAPDDGLLDGDPDSPDEVVFMLRDVGDPAPITAWPEGADASAGRIEIELADGQGHQGYVYLYRVPQGFQSPELYAMSYDSTRDEIRSRFYYASFGGTVALKDLAISPDHGGSGVDLVDTQKIRLKMFVLSSLFEINEEVDIVTQAIQARVGPVRVIRRAKALIKPLRTTFTFTSRFYPFSVELGAGAREFAKELRISLIRQSLDLNANAIGMRFYNPRNSGVLIDGTPDSPNRTLDVPGLNWFLLSGPQGSIVSILDVPRLGNRQLLYYRDNASGGTDDGTQDTGDRKSYGDIGIKLEEGVYGTYDFASSRLYLLPANQPPEVAQQLLQNVREPVQRLIRAQQVEAVDGARSPLPREYGTLEVFPNPFRGSATLVLGIPRAGEVKVRAVDITGRCVRTWLVSPPASGDKVFLSWDGCDDAGRPLPAGVYVLRAASPAGPEITRKVVRFGP
ncbi:MAG: hypothetical protein ONB23_02885 [candidate division KSB1 bacterium]|nr:hypothetical protein [candidate division KSB1 bacterium]